MTDQSDSPTAGPGQNAAHGARRYAIVLAESRYALRLLPCSTALHDAIALDGRYVQIKATQRTRVAFYGKPDHLIVLKLARDGSADEIYNGPGEIVWRHVSAVAKNGQCSIAVSKLGALTSRLRLISGYRTRLFLEYGKRHSRLRPAKRRARHAVYHGDNEAC